MRNVPLRSLVWIIEIEYENYADSELQLSALAYPDILSALAYAHVHCRAFWPYEIISIKQKVGP